MTAFMMKNLSIYRLSRDTVDFRPCALEQKLAPLAFTPCSSHDLTKTGWVSPLGEHSDQLVHSVGRHVLLCLQREEKLLPAKILKQHTQERIKKLEAEQGRRLKKDEKSAIADEVLHSLLPRAFSNTSQTWLWIDTDAGLIAVDSSSAKRAEDVLALLRKSLGSLPVVPLATETPTELTLTDWVKNRAAPDGFTIRDEAELKAILEGDGIVRCKNQDLQSDEISSHVEAGKLVTQLALEYQNRVAFVLNDSMAIKRLKFSDDLLSHNDDIDREDFAQRFDADFVLFTGEISILIQDLIDALGGEFSSRAPAPTPATATAPTDEDPDDELYPKAVEFVSQRGNASISGLQREFRIGYNRAGRLVERMEHTGIVSRPSHDGSRQVLVGNAGGGNGNA